MEQLVIKMRIIKGDFMTKKKIIIEDFEESLERDIKEVGNSSHVILPKKHRGKKANVVVGGKVR